jgi:hypothetical protein
METRDWLTIAAIILGPIFAIFLTLYVGCRREKRRAKLWEAKLPS